MRRGSALAGLSLIAALASADPCAAQQFERAPGPLNEHPHGYLSRSDAPFYGRLASPPAVGSVTDDLDLQAVVTLQTTATPERWKSASDDEEYLYPRFVDAFGGPIDREHTPRLVHLLNRLERDVAIPVFASKRRFERLRPYQRLQLTRVCGEQVPPVPNPDSKDRNSYPSGHSAYGWAASLVLAKVAPEHESALLSRGYDYGLSRVICGVHFPSDVEAGRIMASTVLARLAMLPAFRRDLVSAMAEHVGTTAAKGRHSPSRPSRRFNRLQRSSGRGLTHPRQSWPLGRKRAGKELPHEGDSLALSPAIRF